MDAHPVIDLTQSEETHADQKTPLTTNVVESPGEEAAEVSDDESEDPCEHDPFSLSDFESDEDDREEDQDAPLSPDPRPLNAWGGHDQVITYRETHLPCGNCEGPATLNKPNKILDHPVGEVSCDECMVVCVACGTLSGIGIAIQEIEDGPEWYRERMEWKVLGQLNTTRWWRCYPCEGRVNGRRTYNGFRRDQYRALLGAMPNASARQRQSFREQAHAAYEARREALSQQLEEEMRAFRLDKLVMRAVPHQDVPAAKRCKVDDACLEDDGKTSQ